MNKNDKEIQLLYLQLFASTIFIITIIISIILTYNNINKYKKQKATFTKKQENSINLKNRQIVTIIAIIFTYINYKYYEISKIKNNSTIEKDELIASLLTLIVSFILLNTTKESIKNNTNFPNTNSPLL